MNPSQWVEQDIMLFDNIHQLEDNAALLKTWTRAALSTKQVDPFCCTPPWQLSFHEAFAPTRRLLLKESANNLLLFAEHRIPAEDLVVLAPIEESWLFGSPLLGRHSVELLADEMEQIRQLYHPLFPRIVISGVRPTGVQAQRILQQFSRDFRIFLLHNHSSTQGSASLSGGLDGYLSRRSSHHRKKLRQAQKKAIQQGIWFERVAPTTPVEAKQTFARIHTIELTSWKGVNQCGLDQEPSNSFYRHMIRRLSSTHQLRVIFAKHGEQDIGYIFGGLAGRIYRGQQFSYTDSWRSFSIGNLLQTEKIRWLCEERCRRYDMGPVSGPKMEYKRHWTEKQGHLQSWMLIRK